MVAVLVLAIGAVGVFAQAVYKTLVDQFAYPVEGTGMVYRKMHRAIEKNMGRVYLNKAVEKVLVENGKVVDLKVTPE